MRGRRLFYPTRPVAERFWEKIDKSGGPDACWPWLGGRTKKGVGYFSDGRPPNKVQGNVGWWAWRLTYGEIMCVLPGIDVCHECDNGLCGNPAHLWLGTRGDNLRDMWAKGRAWQQQHPERIKRGAQHGRYVHGGRVGQKQHGPSRRWKIILDTPDGGATATSDAPVRQERIELL